MVGGEGCEREGKGRSGIDLRVRQLESEIRWAQIIGRRVSEHKNYPATAKLLHDGGSEIGFEIAIGEFSSTDSRTTSIHVKIL